MKKEDVIKIKKGRLGILKSNGKNIESGGVVRKIEREIRNLEK